MNRTFTIGSAHSNDIVLADPTLSREHAAITVFGDGRVEIIDRGSLNGTSVVRGADRLAVSERPLMLLGSDLLVFGDLHVPLVTLLDIVPKEHDAPPARRDPPPSRPDHAPVPPPANIREFIPILDAFDRMRDRGLVWPAVAFALVIVALFAVMDRPVLFMQSTGVVLTLAAMFLVYRLCGKRTPLWAVAGVMLAEAFVLRVIFFPVLGPIFRPPFVQALLKSTSVGPLFIGHFFGAGLMEEFAKMLPVFGLIWLTRRATSTRGLPRDRQTPAPANRPAWSVGEPLDAILFACASASAFVLDETLGAYVPRMVNDVATESGSAALGLLMGQQLSIVRTLDALTGHLAFSGYFAYFVGLGLLRPHERLRLWVGGWLAASTIHALGNALASSPVIQALVSTTAFLFLLAVIVNARKISPSRRDNFATVGLRSKAAPSHQLDR